MMLPIAIFEAFCGAGMEASLARFPIALYSLSVSMPYRFRVLGLLFALVFVMYLDRLCIAVARPRIQREMGISVSHWGWVIGAFTLSYALFELPERHPGRSDRSAQGADAHRSLVVRRLPP